MVNVPPPPPPAIVEYAAGQTESMIDTSASMWLDYQRDWIQDESDVALWEKSRRVGADFAESFRAVYVRMKGKRSTDYWYSSADESAACEFAVYVRMWLDLYNAAYKEETETDLIDGRDLRVMTFTLPEINGTRPRITVMTSNPTRFRSKGGDVTLSEFAFHAQPDELWKAAAVCTMWGGQLRVISSHNGEDSKFNELLRQAHKHLDPETHGQPRSTDLKATIHRTTIHDAIESGIVEKINERSGQSMTREEFIAKEQAKCSSSLVWDEEYCCIPSRQANSYFPHSLLSPCVRTDAAVPTNNVGRFLADIAERAPAYDVIDAGMDVGRMKDRTVIWVIGKSGVRRDTLGILEWQGAPFDDQESAITALLTQTFGGKRIRRMCIDSSGLGMQLAERMTKRFRSRVEAVKMTMATKEDMFGRLRAAVEERTISLPDDPVTLADISAVRCEITKSGNVRFAADATKDGHSDRAVALALALVANESARAPMRNVKMTGGVV